MIVRILSASASFSGVRYNTDKIDSGKGELMKIANFGALQGLNCWRPEDLKNYLQAISAQNKRVHFPQFHAVISAPGKTCEKEELAKIAEEWLALMGYGDQPYLLVFHKDTANHHIHIVSTRIGRDGKKISSAYENIRAVNNLQKVMGKDEKYSSKTLIENSLKYRFSTIAQFKLLLECRGYTLKEAGDKLLLIKFGQQMGAVSLKDINARLSETADPARLKQIKALLYKYGHQYSTELNFNSGKWSSELAAYLKDKHGLELVFHGTAAKPPYGYTIVDHSQQAVYKGGQALALKQLLGIPCDREKDNDANPEINFKKEIPEVKAYYRALLKAALYNYPDLLQGLHHLGLDIGFRNDEPFIVDDNARVYLRLPDLLNEKQCYKFMFELGRNRESVTGANQQYNPPVPGITLASDIDDEAIHGRNRHRKKKARTNTR